MADTRVFRWLTVVICILMTMRADALLVNITYLTSAVEKGAVCLDGSPPAYHLDRGSSTGINNWLVFLEGGGWCHNVTNCLFRSRGHLGSSKKMDNQISFSAILSNMEESNPDFYNWNRVMIRYCDGSSFTGDVESVDTVTNLHYRGERVWLAVIQELLAKGMNNAENALLTGCSAGGLATILHCDSFRALLPLATKVKCLSDAGYFINAKDISGVQHIQTYFDEIVTLHGSAKNLPLSCTSRMKPSMCFFPQYLVQDIHTPLFVLNAAYDSWQIRNVLVPLDSDPAGSWHDCRNTIRKCSPKQLSIMQGFRGNFICALRGLMKSLANGMFIDSCFAHCQTDKQPTWLSANPPVLGNTTISEAVGNWFYDRDLFQKIDCPYPCDSSCHHLRYDG